MRNFLLKTVHFFLIVHLLYGSWFVYSSEYHYDVPGDSIDLERSFLGDPVQLFSSALQQQSGYSYFKHLPDAHPEPAVAFGTNANPVQLTGNLINGRFWYFFKGSICILTLRKLIFPFHFFF